MKKVYVYLLLIILIFLSGCSKKEYVITSIPDNAEVFCFGRFIGSTPLEINEFNEGKDIVTSPGKAFRIEIKKDFYEKATSDITYSPYKKNKSHFILTIDKKPLYGYDGKLKNNYTLTQQDLSQLTRPQLENLKNEIYAKYGKNFHIPEVAGYFKKQSWYKENPYYDDSFLTPVDKENIEMITKQLETFTQKTDITEMIGIGKPTASDLNIMNLIIKNGEYEYDSGEEETTSLGDDKRNTCILVFEKSNKLSWYDDSNYFGTYYEGIDTHLEWNWQVFHGRVYVWDIRDDESGCILFIFTLDHQKRQITSVPEIDGRIWK
ncbi:MAG: YARHG domain-containing protein [Spirochaetales bacterium]|nr:YARHG domain-containing protein [Spirochaetales bacterium]